MPKYKIDNKEAVEGIIEENLFSQPFMVEMFGTDIEYELDHDTSPDTDEARNPILKQHILVEIQASKQTIELVEAILNDFEIGVKNWLKQYGLESYFDAIYTSEGDVTISIDVPEQDDPWSPEKYAAKGLEIDGSYIPRLIMGALDKLKGAQDLPASVLQEMSDKVVDEIRGAGSENINESYVFVDFLEKLAGEVRNSIKGETIDHIKTTNDNTGLGNTLTVVDTPVIQYSEDKTYAEIDRQVKKMKMALDARAKTIKQQVHQAIEAGQESPVSYVITSAIRPKPSRAEDGKDLGKVTISFYKWGKYQSEEEIDAKDLTDMTQLGQYELEGFDVRDEDIDKTFYAEDRDIDDGDWGSGISVKRAYAITDGKASNGIPVGQNFKVGDKVTLEATYRTSDGVDRNVIEGVIEGTDPVTYNVRRLNKSGQPIKGRSGEILDPSPVYAHHLKHADSKASNGIDLTDDEYTGVDKALAPLQKNIDYFVDEVESLEKSTVIDRITGTVYNIVQLAKAKYKKGDDNWGSDYIGQVGIPAKIEKITNTDSPEIYHSLLDKFLEEVKGYEKNLKAMPDADAEDEEAKNGKKLSFCSKGNYENIKSVSEIKKIVGSEVWKKFSNGDDERWNDFFKNDNGVVSIDIEDDSVYVSAKSTQKNSDDESSLQTYLAEAISNFCGIDSENIASDGKKLREEHNKNVSKGKEDGYPEYKANFENALFKKYGVMIGDTGIEDSSIKEAFDKNETVDNLVNYLGEKHQITPVAAQGTAVEIKSPVKSKSATSKSYICIIKDRFGKEIGSYELDYADDDYVSTFLSAIGVRLKAGDTKEIVEA